MEVALRDVAESDLPILFEHQNDPVANRMAAFTPRDETAFLDHWRTKILADPNVVKKAIVRDGVVVGNIVSFEREGRREIGYWVGRDHWGRGIATEALRRFLECVTDRPVYAIVAKRNVASIRVLEKCGFVTESERRGSPGDRGPAVEERVMRLDT